MRIMITAACAASVALLGACAATPGQSSRYQEEYDRLAAQCTADNGMFVPIPGAFSGNPATDYACRTRSASRLD